MLSFRSLLFAICAIYLIQQIAGVPVIPQSPLLNNHNKLDLIQHLEKQIRTKEQELQNAEKINKNFEKMIQLVNILGQVDNFLTDRTKAIIKKLAVMVDDENQSKSSRYSHEDN